MCEVSDNIPHTFVDCIKMSEFWNNFKTWLCIVTNKPELKLSTSEIIFGMLEGPCLNINFCLLYAKWYIHSNKKELNISFECFKKYLKGVLLIEKQIALDNDTITHFRKCFMTMWNSLIIDMQL